MWTEEHLNRKEIREGWRGSGGEIGLEREETRKEKDKKNEKWSLWNMIPTG